MKKILFLQNRNFRLLCFITLVSSIGDSLYSLAITLTVYQASGSVVGVAGMWLIRALVRIPAQFAAGIVSDRFNRKAVSIWIYSINTVLVAAFLFTGNRYLMAAYVIIFILQGTQDIDNVAQSAMLPELVSKEELITANSMFQMLGSVAMFVGPGLGAVLYKVCGAWLLYLIDSMTFAFAAVMMAMVKYQHYNGKEERKNEFHLFRYARDGFMQIIKNRYLVMLLMVMMGYSVLGRFYEIDKIYLVNDVMGRGEEDIVSFSYAMSIGSLLAPLLVQRLREKAANWKGFATASICGILCLILWVNSGSMGLAFGAVLLFSIFNCFVGISFQTVYQAEVENQYLGRVMAFYKIFTVLSSVIGILLAPVLLETLGIGLSFLSVGVIVICLILGISIKERGKMPKQQM